MLKKIKQWFRDRAVRRDPTVLSIKEEVETYTRKQMEQAYKLGYNDGKRDGLTVAREQATKSLKEILWQQNENHKS